MLVVVNTTMNVSLPASLKSFVDEQVTGRGYGTCSEYVRALIRQDHDRQHLRRPRRRRVGGVEAGGCGLFR